MYPLPLPKVAYMKRKIKKKGKSGRNKTTKKKKKKALRNEQLNVYVSFLCIVNFTLLEVPVTRK